MAKSRGVRLSPSHQTRQGHRAAGVNRSGINKRVEEPGVAEDPRWTRPSRNTLAAIPTNVARIAEACEGGMPKNVLTF